MYRLLAILLLTTPMFADLPAAQAKDDQEQARQAVERGEIRPLEEILAAARKAVPGEVVKLDLKRDGGRWVYELKILTPGGKRREVEVDAKSLAILEEEEDD